MNILIDKLPLSVGVGGKEYKINSDFRASILFELLMQDSNISDEQKIIQALQIYFEEIPDDIERAINEILKFYSLGKEVKKGKTKGTSKGKQSQIYSFEHDADYIYCAFLSQYGIDLNDIKYLHWYKFRALFNGLSEDNEIVKIMKYRATDLNKIKDKEQKEFYKKMKETYKIPMSEEEEKKVDEIAKALQNGTFNKNLL